MICVLNAEGTAVYRSGRTLDSEYTYSGLDKSSNGNVLLSYSSPDDSDYKYTILSQNGGAIVEYVDEAFCGHRCMLYVDGNEWIAVLEDDRLVPTGIKGDSEIYQQPGDLLVLETPDSRHVINEFGEKFEFEFEPKYSWQSLQCYEGEDGEIFVTGVYESMGLYSTKRGEILPEKYTLVEMASSQLLAVENTLLGHGWGYVVVLK